MDRPVNNDAVIEEARKLPPGQVVVLFQPRLQAEIDGWLIRGDLDVLRLERHADGALDALITDLKSTTEAKVEHRLQVAFYHLMLARLFEQHGVSCAQIQTSVLFRGPAEPTPTQAEQLKPLREAARTWLGLDEGLLEVVADPDAYLQAVRDLVVGPDSTARRVALAPFEAIPYSLSYKCDGCLYNEFCLKWSAEREDLSLLPYMSGVEKEALRRHGIDTIEALARLKELGPDGELTTAAGQETLVRHLAATWPVGPRLDEVIHRARSFRRNVKKDGTAALGYIPGKGTSTLPVSTPDRNPNLVRVYVEAQHDYLHDRIYLLGALVVACKDGRPDPARRRAIVRMTDGPPEKASQERDLFVEWTQGLVQAVVELAAPGEQRDGKNTAPIHLIFFDRHEQRMLLEALARNFPPILQATPAAVRLPHATRRLRLARGDLPRRGGPPLQELPDDLPEPPVAGAPSSSSTGTRRTGSGRSSRPGCSTTSASWTWAAPPSGTRSGPGSAVRCRWNTPTPPGGNCRRRSRAVRTSGPTTGA